MAPVVLGRARASASRRASSTRTSRSRCPAHVAARSVDVLAAPVYHWRAARGRRALDHAAPARAPRSCDDRLRAVEWVTRVPRACTGPARCRTGTRPASSPTTCGCTSTCSTTPTTRYRAMFMTRVNALLDGASRPDLRAAAGDRAAQVAARAARAARRAARGAALPEAGGRRHADRARAAAATTATTRSATDRALGLPRSTFRLGRRDEDLALTAQLDAVRRRRQPAAVGGHACDRRARRRAASGRRSPRCAAAAGAPLRLRLAGVRLPTAPARAAGPAAATARGRASRPCSTRTRCAGAAAGRRARGTSTPARASASCAAAARASRSPRPS